MGKETKQKKFYYGSDEQVRNAGSLSTFTPSGTYQKVSTDALLSSGSFDADEKSDYIPGIEVIDYAYVPGKSTEASSAINIASKKLYTYVRHLNSGSRNYDSPDLTNYCYVTGALYGYISELERVYGICMKYSGKNRFLGKALCEAAGFDYDSIVADLAGFRTYINVVINKVGALKVPNAWPGVTRQVVLNGIVLKDGDIDKSQLILFRLKWLWQYNESGTYVGSITPVNLFPNPNVLITFNNIKTFIDSVINSLVASEDVNIMSGDILKAYGEDKCLSMSLIPDDYSIEPIYDRDILSYYHNIDFYAFNTTVEVHAGSYPTGFVIAQDTTRNCLIFNPTVTLSAASETLSDTPDATNIAMMNPENTYIDLLFDDAQPYDIMNAAAAKNLLSKTNFPSEYGDTITLEYATFGSELFYSIRCFATPNHDDQNSGNTFTLVTTRIALTTQDSSGNLVELNSWRNYVRFSKHTRFDWAPMLYVRFTGYSKGDFENHGTIFGDMYNFTKATATDCKKMHEVQILASFGLD